jgi:SAM-dependent methyltransferase
MLEIGAGVGSLLSLVAQEGWQVDGIEPDAEYARAGRETYGVSITPAFYEDVAFAEGEFGLIATFHVLEHVLSPTTFLEKAHRDLAEGGYLFIEVPSVDRPYGGNLDFFFWAPHLTSFGKATLSALLRKTGFEPVWTGYSGDFLQVIARKSVVRSIKLPARDPDRVLRSLHAYATAWRVKKSPVFDPLRSVVRRVRALVASASDETSG